MFGRVRTPDAARGTSTEVVIDDDWTDTVMTMPIMIATNPEPAPSALLIAASTRSATRRRMFLVM